MAETWQPSPAADRLDLWTFVDGLSVGAAAKVGPVQPRSTVEAPSERFRRFYQCLALRTEAVSFDESSRLVLERVLAEHGRLCFVAKSADDRSQTAYASKLAGIRRHASAPSTHGLVFLEAVPDACGADASSTATITSEHGFTILRAHGKSIPTVLGAVLMRVATDLRVRPEIYLDWSERNPLLSALDYLTTGRGDIAPVLREILRRAQPNAALRPRVRVA